MRWQGYFENAESRVASWPALRKDFGTYKRLGSVRRGKVHIISEGD